MALSPQWLDELRSRVTLSTVIQRTTRLQKAGREWKACCPFHDEKTPSFTVNDAKGFYHCFGCQAHGDVIRWMTDQRGLGFIDAVKELASEAGMELPAPDPQAAKRAERRASLHDVMQAAQDWFVANLGGADGTEARAYLERRGVSPETARTFGFGFAPAASDALGRALSRFDAAMLVEAGLRSEQEDGGARDRFRGRLTLPIRDPRGRVIGFGGRVLDPASKAPKYLNSPDTPLFDKGRTLYNLDRAAPAARRAGRLIVVEGYMDVVALAGAGIEEAVAPMGTALTEAQLELAWRHAGVPVLCFDGDAAGRRAAMKAIARALRLLAPERSLAFARIPAGQDPDDLVRAGGAEAAARLLDAPATLLDTLWEAERDAAPLRTPEDKAGLKARLMESADAIVDREIRSLYRRELGDRFSAFAYPPRATWSSTGSRPRAIVPSAAARPAGSQRDHLIDYVLAGFAADVRAVRDHAEELAELAALEPTRAERIDRLFARADRLEGEPDAPISTARLAEALSLLVERPALDRALEAATARFETDPDGAFSQQQALLKRKLELDARLIRMAGVRAGAHPATAPGEAAAVN